MRRTHRLYQSIRVVERDGEALMVTMDYRPTRYNVAVKDGVIVRFVNMG